MSLFKVSRALLLAGICLTPPVSAQAPVRFSPNLEREFRTPPASARPRVWWHWMNGNVTKPGIAKDLAWMKRIGIGGLQNFDVNLSTPTIVERKLAYMSPEWREAFRFAAAEADRLDLELAIASSPGWSETGGPWVKPENGLKKLVWSETEIEGGRRFRDRLPQPPSIAGQFGSLPQLPDLTDLLADKAAKQGPSYYGDVAVLAVPSPITPALPDAQVVDGTGKLVEARLLTDDDMLSGVTLPSAISGQPAQLNFNYAKPITIRSASLFMPGAAIHLIGAFVGAELQASDDGKLWRSLATIPIGEVPATVSFPAVTTRKLRMVFRPVPMPPPGSDAPDMGVAMENPFGKMIGQKLAQPLVVGDLRFSAEARVDRFEEKAGFALVRDYDALTVPRDDAVGPAPERTIDLTSRMRSDGSLDWTPPPGRWRILRLGYSLLGTTNHPAPSEATGLEVDKFDGEAVRGYMEHYLATYRAVTGPDLIGQRGVRALLTDSIEVGAANWTPKMIAQFRRLRGYDPLPWLPTLTGTIIGSRAHSDRFLYDYRRTLADLIATEHYGTVATVAHEQGLKVYGEALESNRPTLGDDMAMRRFTDVPMAAMWAFERKAGPSAGYVADIRGAASVAHIYGQNLVAAESMTATMMPWAYGPADLKHIMDLEFLLGVNRPVIHTSVHAPVDDKKPGLSLGGIGQYFNRQESWAELATPWIDYISRNSLLLQQGINVADVGYFYGEEGPLTALYGNGPAADAPRTSNYDFVNADALQDALANEGADLVTPGGARYKLLYLGGASRRMTLKTLRRIATLVEGGATVVGLRPTDFRSLADDTSAFTALADKLWPGGSVTQIGRGRVIASQDVEAALRLIHVGPDFRFNGAGEKATIPFVHRRMADGDSYFLVNQGDRTETIDARFRVAGKAPELWNATTGSIRATSYRIEGGETVVPLTLSPGEAAHVVFRKPTQTDRFTLPAPPTSSPIMLDRPWTVSFEAGRGAPAGATFDRLAPLNQNADPGIKYFSGIAAYTTTFTTPKGWEQGQPLTLDLGEAREVAEVRVNGVLAGYAWHAPYQVDVAAVARPGRNRLEIRVANLWVNRMIGDQQPGATKVTWTGYETYRANAPLRRSGLIGPVRLVPGK